jgi:ankyrin repeat protein
LEIVRKLVDKGAEVDGRLSSSFGETPLQAAADGHIDVVGLLIKTGADVNARLAKYRGATAIQNGCGWRDIAVVCRLLKSGVAANSEGCYYHEHGALAAAAENRYMDVVEMLLKAGSGIEATSGDNHQTALQHAMVYGHTEVAEFLLREQKEIDRKLTKETD